jgi:hypothetical protein
LVVFAIRTFAFDGAFKAPITKPASNVIDSSLRQLEGLSDPGVGPGRSLRPFVCLEQNPSPSLFAGRTFPPADAFEKILALLWRQFDSILLGRHDRIEKCS